MSSRLKNLVLQHIHTPIYFGYLFFCKAIFFKNICTQRKNYFSRSLFFSFFNNRIATCQLKKPQRVFWADKWLIPLLMNLQSWANLLASFALISACRSGLLLIILVFASWSKCISSTSCYATCLCSPKGGCAPVFCCLCSAKKN